MESLELHSLSTEKDLFCKYKGYLFFWNYYYGKSRGQEEAASELNWERNVFLENIVVLDYAVLCYLIPQHCIEY